MKERTKLNRGKKQELSNKTIDLFSILGNVIDYSRLTESLIKGFRDHFDVESEFIVQDDAERNLVCRMYCSSILSNPQIISI